MALTLRTIETDVGKELMNCDGTPAASITVSFRLVTAGGGLASIVDTNSGENILTKTIEATTGVTGSLSISLWPTSRGDKLCYYQVSVPNGPNFKAPLPDGVGNLSWEDFVTGRVDTTV